MEFLKLNKLKDEEVKKGATGLVIGFPLFFGLIIPTLFGLKYSITPWIIGAVFIPFIFWRPLAFRYFYLCWMNFAIVLGTINSKILLTIVYILMFIPLGILFRIMGRDILKRKWDKDLKSYFTPIDQPRETNHLERPF
jgi:hypothetical protein